MKKVGLRLEDELYELLEERARNQGVPPTTLANRMLSELLVGGTNANGGEHSAEPLSLILERLDELDRKLSAPPAAATSQLRVAASERPSRVYGSALDEIIFAGLDYPDEPPTGELNFDSQADPDVEEDED